MGRVREWMRRFAGMFGKPGADARLEEELQSHLEMLADEKMQRGMNPEEAKRAARMELGGAEQIKEAVRNQRGLPLLESLAQDIRFSLRMLRKTPGFTAVTLLTLALGIGVNTAVFSLIDSLIVRSLPVRDPQQLLTVKWTARKIPNVGYDSFVGTCSEAKNGENPTGCSFSVPFYRTFDAQNDVFSALAAYAPTTRLKTNVGNQTVLAFGDAVSGNYFQTLGIQPFLGRVLDDADDRPSAGPVIVLSHAFWQETLGGNPAIVGQTVNVGGATFTVVGVAQEGFVGIVQHATESFWIPLSSDALVRSPIAIRTNAPQNWWISIVGRLKPGISNTAAEAAATSIFAGAMKAQRSFFSSDAVPKITLVPTEREFTAMREEASKPLFPLMGVVGIVLLIACANIGGLCLARGTTRAREMAVRQTVGASRRRLVRQMFTESVTLSLAGGACGCLLAFWATDGLRPQLARIARGLPQVISGPNPRVLIFTAAISIVAAVLFGLAPALWNTRLDLSAALKIVDGGGLKRSGALGRFGLGGLLVIMQMALTVALLAGAGLLLRTLRNLETVDIGFDSKNLLLFTTDWGTEDFTLEQLNAFNRRFVDQLRALPGVISASYSGVAPLDGALISRNICCSGTSDHGSMRVDELPVSPEFFSTMRVPTFAGRALQANDFVLPPKSDGTPASGQKPVQKALTPIDVNLEFVRRYFAGQDVLGKVLGNYQVVGVAGDVKYGNLRREIQPAIYSPVVYAASFEMRTQPNPEALIPEVRDVAARIDSQVKLEDVTTQEGQIKESIAGDRFITNLLTSFAGLALALACIGVFGLLSYEVSSQTREIGIRMALGAQRHIVLQAVMAKGMAASAVGAGLGLVLACGVTRYIESQLYEVHPIDGVTFAGAAFVLLMAALAACWIPARRAMCVDPMVALRHE